MLASPWRTFQSSLECSLMTWFRRRRFMLASSSSFSVVCDHTLTRTRDRRRRLWHLRAGARSAARRQRHRRRLRGSQVPGTPLGARTAGARGLRVVVVPDDELSADGGVAPSSGVSDVTGPSTGGATASWVAVSPSALDLDTPSRGSMIPSPTVVRRAALFPRGRRRLKIALLRLRRSVFVRRSGLRTQLSALRSTQGVRPGTRVSRRTPWNARKQRPSQTRFVKRTRRTDGSLATAATMSATSDGMSVLTHPWRTNSTRCWYGRTGSRSTQPDPNSNPPGAAYGRRPARRPWRALVRLHAGLGLVLFGSNCGLQAG